MKMNEDDMDKYIYGLLAPKNKNAPLKSTFFDESIFNESERNVADNNISKYKPPYCLKNKYNIRESNSLLLRGTLNYKLKYERKVKSKKKEKCIRNEEHLRRSKSFNSYFNNKTSIKDKELIDYISRDSNNDLQQRDNITKKDIVLKLNKLETDIQKLTEVLDNMSTLLLKINNILNSKYDGSSFYAIDPHIEN